MQKNCCTETTNNIKYAPPSASALFADLQWKWWLCGDGGDNCMLAFDI